ncbi:MAG: glycosyltransferase [Peptostreptococcaceae bacterium]|nr:glycosyltransferase [Peptostreptococcaceae bacterium]
MSILIVSPAYPPYSGVGAMRMNSLSRYLRDNDEDVIVLRNTPDFWGENNLKAEVPLGIEIIDVNACLSAKDNELLYYCAIYEILRRKTIKLIVYSVGPFYTLRVAPIIKKKYNIKYIVDFRDLWVYENLGNRGFLRNIKHYISMYRNRLVEKDAVKNANGIVVVSHGDNQIMKRHYKNQKENIVTIFNGFEKFSEISEKSNNKTEKDSIFNLVSLGKLGYYSNELVELLFKAVYDISKEGYRIRIMHVGNREDYVTKLLKNNDYLNAIYNCTGYVSYEQGIIMTKQSDICLIIYNHPTGLGTKVFDYIACNKPIVLITKQGKALSNFISSFENGYVCNSTDDIIKTINYILENNIKKLDDKKELNKYSREYQNKHYHELIYKIKMEE